jgi:hypothetical protein
MLVQDIRNFQQLVVPIFNPSLSRGADVSSGVTSCDEAPYFWGYGMYGQTVGLRGFSWLYFLRFFIVYLNMSLST